MLTEYVNNKKKTNTDYDENRPKPFYMKKQITKDINEKIRLDSRRFQTCVNIFNEMLQKCKKITGSIDLFEYLKRKMKSANHFYSSVSMMPYEFTSNMIEILNIVCKRNNLSLEKLAGVNVKTISKPRSEPYQSRIGNKIIYTLEKPRTLSTNNINESNKIENKFSSVQGINRDLLYNGSSSALSGKKSSDNNLGQQNQQPNYNCNNYNYPNSGTKNNNNYIRVKASRSHRQYIGLKKQDHNRYNIQIETCRGNYMANDEKKRNNNNHAYMIVGGERKI